MEDLKKSSSLQERYITLDKILKNIEEEPLSFYTSEEQLYLVYLIQEKGIDMGLCPHFYIFFSKKNRRFHHICRATEKNKEHIVAVRSKNVINNH